jgi:lysophospholipase L1-like esterase
MPRRAARARRRARIRSASERAGPAPVEWTALMLVFFALSLALAWLRAGNAHGDPKLWPINPQLGVSGFPDCRRVHPEWTHLSMEEASFDLDCAAPRDRGESDAIRIACVGDSITAGVHSTGGNHTYPFQLQMLLDSQYGWGRYTVTNLGACGSTMLRFGDSPYWERPQFQALVSGEWDVVTIMLGTNDAKDDGSVHSKEPKHNDSDWQHDCGDVDHTTVEGCTFAADFAAMVRVARTHGRGGRPAKVLAMVPPPLMQDRAYGMNQTVINSILPKLMPLIAQADGLDGVIDMYTGMGGVSDWKEHFPPHGCTLNSSSGSGGDDWAPCAWWCDTQSCDQCHPNNNGYAHMAQKLHAGLVPHLPPAPPVPPTPPAPPGVWVYEAQGTGRLFVPLSNFSANHHSGRGGVLAWDACYQGVNGTRFDDGTPLWPTPAGTYLNRTFCFNAQSDCPVTHSDIPIVKS